MSGYEKLAGMMKALGHPVRLQILEALREEEACVCHLEAHLGQRQAYISQQLARLREAGLVVDRRDGMNVYYSLADDFISAFLDSAREAVVAQAQAEGNDLAFRPLVRNASCPCPKCQARQDVAVA
jgi:ArsR family transcriptional regulator